MTARENRLEDYLSSIRAEKREKARAALMALPETKRDELLEVLADDLKRHRSERHLEAEREAQQRGGPAKLCGDELQDVVRDEARRELAAIFGRPLNAEDVNGFREVLAGSTSNELEQERTAYQIRRRVLTALHDAAGFAARYERGSGGYFAEELSGLVEVLELERHPGPLACTPHQIGQPPADDEGRRLVVLNFRRPGRLSLKPGKVPTDRELALVSLMAGNWPESIRPTEELTVEHVIRLETGTIKKTRQRLK